MNQLEVTCSGCKNKMKILRDAWDERDALKARLQPSPQGDDKIDELEQSVKFLQARIAELDAERDTLREELRQAQIDSGYHFGMANQQRERAEKAEKELWEELAGKDMVAFMSASRKVLSAAALAQAEASEAALQRAYQLLKGRPSRSAAEVRDGE